MDQKKIYIRTEFADLLRLSAAEMAQDEDLRRLALDVLVRVDRLPLAPPNDLAGRADFELTARHVRNAGNYI